MHAAKRSSNTRVGGTRDKREGIELYSILGYLVHSSCTYARYYDVNERYIGRVEYRVFYSSPSDRRTGRPRAYNQRASVEKHDGRVRTRHTYYQNKQKSDFRLSESTVDGAEGVI